MIRPATINEVNIIVDLANKIWPDTYKSILSIDQIKYMMDMMYSKDTLYELIDSKEQQFFILYEEKKPTGFMSLQPKTELPSAIYKLNKLYVLQNTQGKGYGKMLISYACDHIRSLGAETLELNVNRQNKALGFYQKTGFTIIKEEDIPIGRGYQMQDYVLQKSV